MKAYLFWVQGISVSGGNTIISGYGVVTRIKINQREILKTRETRGVYAKKP